MADSIQNTSAPIFVGEFCHAIDGKHRVTVPSDWRFEEEVELFLIPTTTNTCLKVMPRAEIDRIRNEAASLSQAERSFLLRRIGNAGRRVILDKNGRLTVPEAFCQQFKLTGNVTLSGAIETFEIWNTEDFEAARVANNAIADAVAAKFGI
jgi:MraZ protein